MLSPCCLCMQHTHVYIYAPFIVYSGGNRRHTDRLQHTRGGVNKRGLSRKQN